MRTTQAFTRADLERAYNNYVERYGRGPAVEAIERSTDTMFMCDVSGEKIANAMAALAKPPATRIGGKMRAHRDRSKSVQDTLNAMAEAIYAKGRLKARR